MHWRTSKDLGYIFPSKEVERSKINLSDVGIAMDSPYLHFLDLVFRALAGGLRNELVSSFTSAQYLVDRVRGLHFDEQMPQQSPLRHFCPVPGCPQALRNHVQDRAAARLSGLLLTEPF